MKSNFCQIDSIVSTCGATNPEKCKYYQKASYHNRCMYQSFLLNEHYNCSSSEAQNDAIREREREEEEDSENMYIEYMEGNIST